MSALPQLFCRHALTRRTRIAALFGTLLAACATPPPPATSAAGTATAPTTGASRAATPAAPPAPAAATPIAAPPPAAEVVGENAVFFASGSTRVDAAGEARLRNHAARLKENAKLDVTLVGHTDNLGSSAYNLAIAEQRAAAVARMLQAMGVARRQIRHYGVGDEKGGPTCRTAACRQQKRRVDLSYSE